MNKHLTLVIFLFLLFSNSFDAAALVDPAGVPEPEVPGFYGVRLLHPIVYQRKRFTPRRETRRIVSSEGDPRYFSTRGVDKLLEYFEGDILGMIKGLDLFCAASLIISCNVGQTAQSFRDRATLEVRKSSDGRDFVSYYFQKEQE